MKNMGLAVFVILFCSLGYGEVRDLSHYLDFATDEEKDNLGLLLQQIQLVPAKDPETGKDVFKVESVDEGSVYYRMGARKGDLVNMEPIIHKRKKMEIEDSL